MKRLLPPHLTILLLAAIAALAVWHPAIQPIRDRALPWDIPLILGIAVLAWARIHFARKRAEIMTFGTPRALITDGPFRWSRNPMYLGFALVLLAAALFVNLWCALLAPLALVAISALWYIPFEERTLRRLFGTDFDAYAGRTRRWL